MIYFIRSLERGHIKIGFTSNLETYKLRMARINSEENGIEYLGCKDGDRREEARLHKLFAGSRAYRREWFHDTQSLRMFIGLNCDPPPPTPSLKRGRTASATRQEWEYIKLEADAHREVQEMAKILRLTKSQVLLYAARTAAKELGSNNRFMTNDT